MSTVAEAEAPAAVSAIEKPASVPAGWEPNVIAFACHYCAFAAADLAGVMRLSYPPNVKVIRLPCTASWITCTCCAPSKGGSTAFLSPADCADNAITWRVMRSREEGSST